MTIKLPEISPDPWFCDAGCIRSKDSAPLFATLERLNDAGWYWNKPVDEANARAAASVPQLLAALEACFDMLCAKNPQTESDKAWIAEQINSALLSAGCTIEN